MGRLLVAEHAVAAEGATLRHARAGLQTPRRSPGGRGSRHAGFEAQGRRRGGGFAHRRAHSPSGSAALRTKRASARAERTGSIRPFATVPGRSGTRTERQKRPVRSTEVARTAGVVTSSNAVLDTGQGLRKYPAPVAWSAAMDVGGWLRGLGLGKYEAAFHDNGIDELILPHLTVEDSEGARGCECRRSAKAGHCDRSSGVSNVFWTRHVVPAFARGSQEGGASRRRSAARSR